MKAKILIVFIGGAFLAALAFQIKSINLQANEPAPFGAEAFRLDDATYHRLAKAALAGDCDAAYRLGRHHAFYAVNRDEAVRWYRIAAKCPHADAKEELLGILMYTPEDDAEVDRLLSEIEQINPKMAESDRESVAAMRSLRARPNK